MGVVSTRARPQAVGRLERHSVASERNNLGTGHSLHNRVSLDVVPMRMARDHDPDVADVQPEFFDVRHDERVHIGAARVVENVAVRHGDE